MNERYEGQCHCGAIKFSFEGKTIDAGLRCNCSICARKGALMSTQVIPEEDIKLNIKDDESLGLYQFGEATAKHYFCLHCGIYTHHETARFPDAYRVNLGCIDSVNTFELSASVFDGKHLL